MKSKKYYSLYSEVKEKILSGEYPSGQRLPSKRVMADISGYSTVTVERAYAMLEDEGYIRTSQRSGYFVSLTDLLPPGTAKQKKRGSASYKRKPCSAPRARL